MQYKLGRMLQKCNEQVQHCLSRSISSFLNPLAIKKLRSSSTQVSSNYLNSILGFEQAPSSIFNLLKEVYSSCLSLAVQSDVNSEVWFVEQVNGEERFLPGEKRRHLIQTIGLLGRVAIGAPNISKFSKTRGISHKAASDCQKVQDFGWNWDRLLLQSIFWTNTFMWKRMSRGCKWIFSQCHLPYCKQIEFVHNKSDLIRCRLFWREQFCKIENTKW